MSAPDPRGIEIRPRWAVADPLAGESLSIFRGRGFEFDELRPYQPGDEISSIEWNVYARTGEVFCRRDIEERELTVLLLFDASPSTAFGSGASAKGATLGSCAQLVAAAGLTAHDRVGAISFADKIGLEARPARGRAQARRLEELLRRQEKSTSTDLSAPLQWALSRRQRSLVFLFSDFLAPVPEELEAVAARHDLVAVRITDPSERELPAAGLVEFRDPETGEPSLFDTSSAAVRAAYAEKQLQSHELWSHATSDLGIDLLDLEAGQDPREALRSFLATRSGNRGS